VSDYRAIAAMTATLQNILQPAVSAAVPGAPVRPARPEKSVQVASPGEVHLFLYQVSPNAALRNAELPVRRSDGTLIRRPQVALDLHYLITFYGDEGKYVPQLLLGAVVAQLHAQPFPQAEDLPRPGGSQDEVAGSGIGLQLDRLRFTPLALAHDDLSKLWSIFFQVPYALSVAYLCSVVLIEPDLTPQAPLPIRRPVLSVNPGEPPQVDRVSPSAAAGTGAAVTLHGSHLAGEGVAVAFGETAAAAAAVSPTSVTAAVPESLAAGQHPVRVVFGGGAGARSNAVPFTLLPEIVGDPAVAASGGAASLRLAVTPPVDLGQRVSVWLEPRRPAAAGSGADAAGEAASPGADPDAENDGSAAAPPAAAAPQILAAPPDTRGGEVVVPLAGVAAGRYLVRVVVDGATSRLRAEEGDDGLGPWIGPAVEVP
jgi:hypothetical protein